MVIVNSFNQPESTIRLQQADVRAVLDKKDLGLGTLFISDSTLSWQEKDDKGFSIDFPDISLHAISRDRNLHPRDSIYIIVDSHFCLQGDDVQPQNGNGDEGDSEASEADISELILEPQNPLTIPALYETLKICQELNPDPADVDDEDDDDLYADAEMDEDEYVIRENRGAGDQDVNDLSRRLQNNSVNIQYDAGDDNQDEEYEDAD
ncbi:unnamed protein product [Brassicogethes aeneus]|uniref:Methylosome subunit pICln n=1 Tax=Brassicogethes aeneus TaxID=1431903 RepID=A0A9P0ARI6_BRAAE|nr:unnamed protein product [Brassicogethes aeneus]